MLVNITQANRLRKNFLSGQPSMQLPVEKCGMLFDKCGYHLDKRPETGGRRDDPVSDAFELSAMKSETGVQVQGKHFIRPIQNKKRLAFF